MSLSNIKLANKKAKHERLRKQKRGSLAGTRSSMKVRRGRMKKMHDEGRKEMRGKRAREMDQVNQLMGELSGEV
jgi:hypothetical protein